MMSYRWIAAVVGLLLMRSHLRESFRKTLKCVPSGVVRTMCRSSRNRSDGKFSPLVVDTHARMYE